MSSAATPRGDRYVVARWKELTATDAPWWSRSPGVGIRMYLRELTDMALAGQQGALADATLARVLKDAPRVVLQKGAFLHREFKPTAMQVKVAVDAASAKSGRFYPLGRNHAAVSAALLQLDDGAEPLVEIIATTVAQDADSATGWLELADLDDLIVLLDDELAYEGFSRGWRHQLAEDVRLELDKGVDLAVAITSMYEANREGWPREIVWVFPVEQVEIRRSELLNNRYLDEEAAIDLVTDWQELPDELVDGTVLKNGCFEISVPASADLEASLELAEDWLDRQLSLWRLQGGHAHVAARAYWHDPRNQRSGVQERPTPLDLLPRSLERFDRELVGEPSDRDDSSPRFVSGLPDAIAQLAQARTSARGAALADLWMVAEAVFGGSAAETRAEAAGVMSEVARALYPKQLLEWLGREIGRLTLAGVTAVPADEDLATWVLDVIDNHRPVLLAAITSDEHALLYVRVLRFLAWPGSGVMEGELKDLGERMRRVADRAYLVRNFYVHSAQPYRAAALAATLPVFSDLVRECLDFVGSSEEHPADPIQAAKLAVMRTARVASKSADEKPGSQDLMRQHLA